ncbi:MAG: carbohydrate-binding domain-containing protein [Candidatus Omnitrophica bacterium]|nr:carbohydrate-binding domain-containing protein [Candidatus Omnitrophota bacterium]
MKKILINITCVFFYIILEGLALSFFLSDTALTRAKELESAGEINAAEKMYQTAIFIDPSSAEPYAKKAEFLLRKNIPQEDQRSYFDPINDLCAKAIKLNPRHAEYRYIFGEVKLDMLERDLLTPQNAVKQIFDPFSKSIERDKYNFKLNYLIGHSMLTIWKHLSKEERDFALSRLRYVMKRRPDYGRYVYPEIIYYTGDSSLCVNVTPENFRCYNTLYYFIQDKDLWQLRGEVASKRQTLLAKEDPEKSRQIIEDKESMVERFKERGKENTDISDRISRNGWCGEDTDERYTFTNGDMCWNGTIDAAISMPRGKAVIMISAKGTPADGTFPYMIVELDGQEIGESYVKNTEWQDYAFEVETSGGIKVLSVTFTNDKTNKKKNEDRNLFIGEARVLDKE